jgi:glycerol kinase
VVRPRVQETTALGAAYLAGLAAGVWKSTDEISARWQVERTFEPGMDREKAQAMRARWARAVERAKGWEEPLP